MGRKNWTSWKRSRTSGRIHAEPKGCSQPECGNVPLYRDANKGYCKVHKPLAVAAAAEGLAGRIKYWDGWDGTAKKEWQ